jgi:hypothetical protein
MLKIIKAHIKIIFVLLQMKQQSVALLRKLDGHCSPLSSSRGRVGEKGLAQPNMENSG